MDDLTAFLPDYPAIQNEDFFRSIVSKREFWEREEFPQFFQHQVNIARFMSQWTLYDSLLLFHEMGTGKSGVTVALTELCRKQSDCLFRKIVYITHNQPLIDNYKKEIEKFSPRLVELNKGREAEKTLRWNTILKNDGYEFYTMGVLDSEFSKKPDNWIQQNYENTIFLIDEAHHLVKSKKENTIAYEQLRRILDLIQKKKVLVMTGTPITDKLDEIEPLLRLVLPSSLQEDLPPREEFMSTFFEVESTVDTQTGEPLPIYRWKPKQREHFQRLLRGRVSYIRRKTTDVKVTYEGSIYPPMQSLHLVVNPMQDIQNFVYRKYFESEAQKIFAEEEEKKKKGESSFYAKSRQASLFVFPEDEDQPYEDEDDVQTIWNHQRKAASDFVTENRFTLQPSYLRKMFGSDTTFESLRMVNNQEILNTLARYSATYTRVIREILEHPNELVYIFCDLKEKSGVIVLQALLRSIFQFQLVRSRNDLKRTPEPRLIVLNDPFTEEKDFQELIQYFNDPENADAKLCQVIIGTEKTSEGISLKNVQQIHILTPSWNMGTMSQAMARSLRAQSHKPGQRVRIFLHAAVPTEEEEEGQEELLIDYSIDFQRYFRAEIKERNLKLIERVFLESSWDCMMNMEINSKTGRFVDGSRECEYSLCEYECEGVNKDDPQGTDYSNWNIFYSSVSKENLLTQIKHLFRQKSCHRKQDLFENLRQIINDDVLIYQTLQEVVQHPIMLKDYRGFHAFLSFDYDSYFLVDNPYLPNPYFLEQPIGNHNDGRFYQENPSTLISFPFVDVLDAYYIQHVVHIPEKDIFENFILDLLRKIENKDPKAKSFFESFPIKLKQFFVEEVLLAQKKKRIPNIRIKFLDWFSKEFPSLVLKDGQTIEHFFTPDRKSRILIGDQWQERG